MGKLRGISVTLYDKTQTGADAFGRPTYTETAETVKNVLVGQPSPEEVTDTLNLTGKRTAYVLGIPKGDKHTWTDRKVAFWGETFKTIGSPERGIEDLVPLSWHKKVKVERYE